MKHRINLDSKITKQYHRIVLWVKKAYGNVQFPTECLISRLRTIWGEICICGPPPKKIHRQVRSSAPSCGPLHIYKQNSDYSHHTHGTVFLSQLEMQILEAHRKQARLTMLRRMTHGMLEVSPTTGSAVPGIAISNQFSKQQPESIIVLCPSQWRLGTRTVSGPATSKSSQLKP